MPDIVRQPGLEPIRFDPTVDPAFREVTFRSPLSEAPGPEWTQIFLEEMATGTEVSGFDYKPHVRARVLEFTSHESTVEAALAKISQAIRKANEEAAKIEGARQAEANAKIAEEELLAREMARLRDKFKNK